MTVAVIEIEQCGNNLGIRFPVEIASAAHLNVHQRIRVSVKGGRLIIMPVVDLALTLEQRLALFDPARHGGEAMSASV